jgi:hypothetical protein
MRTFMLFLGFTLLLGFTACNPVEPVPPEPTSILEPSRTPIIALPTSTSLPYDPSIYTELRSYTDGFGSLAGLFEFYEKEGYCDNPFKEGYPRMENGEWHFFQKNAHAGNFIIHDAAQDVANNEQVFFISTSTSGRTLADFRNHYKITIPIGALVSFSIEGSFIHCLINENGDMVRDFLYSPSSNDFVYIESYNKPLIHHISPIITISGTSIAENNDIGFKQTCTTLSKPGQDYIAYSLPNGDGKVYSWGLKSDCMTITTEADAWSE